MTDIIESELNKIIKENNRIRRTPKRDITLGMFGNPIEKKNKRQPVSVSQKNEVLAQQRNRCARCGKMLDMRYTNFDHKKEVYKGGKSTKKNLQALCANCHYIKTHEDKLKKVEARRRNENKQPKGINDLLKIPREYPPY